MNDINERISQLSPAKRRLLEQKLKQKNSNSQSDRHISPRIKTETSPLSFSQTRMWLLDRLKPGDPLYNRPSNIQISGQLKVSALEKSLHEIIRRHEILRTSFEAEMGKPVQKIAPHLRLTLPVVDLSNLRSPKKDQELERLTKTEANRPFDLAQLPLIRASLLKLDSQEHILLLTMHHIIFDAWSMGVLLRELATLYKSFSNNQSSPLSELPIQYADFSHWQRERLQGELLDSQLNYWKGKLAGDLPVLKLPTDRSRTSVQTNRLDQEHLLLPKDLSESLLALSQQERVTLYMTLLTVFKILLYRYTGQEDLIVGSPIAGRERLETENSIGVFINTLVLRTQLNANLTFKQLLSTVRQGVLEAFAHQEIPVEKLIQELQLSKNLSHTPLFQVLFQLRNVPQQTFEVERVKFQNTQFNRGIIDLNSNSDSLESATESARIFDLNLDIVESPAGLSCVFAYNSALFDAATIKRMTGHFQTLIGGIVANPLEPISQVPMLTSAELNQLLRVDNDRSRSDSVVRQSQKTIATQQFSCYLIGQESFVLKCAELLYERGHQILGIISTGKVIADWAKALEIPHLKSTTDISRFLRQQPCDYLFSIFNLSILPPEILQLPRQYAINWHDSYLPKYAGLNATSWAILNRESTHGGTWHVMSEVVDAGDILKQVTIELAEDETAFTLNGKCYEAAVNSFTELIDEIEKQEISPRKQDLAERSYFLATDKPSAGCLIPWNFSAKKIAALIRGLDFAPYGNPIGLPKLAIDDDFLIVSQIKVLGGLSADLPGTITAIESDSIHVATGSYELAIQKILTVDGQPQSIAELVKRKKLQVGDRFEDLELEKAQRIEKLERQSVKYDNFWLTRLQNLNPVAIAVSSSTEGNKAKIPSQQSQNWTIPSEVNNFRSNLSSESTQADFLLTAFAVYLDRLSQNNGFDLGLKAAEFLRQLVGIEGLFAATVPLSIELDQEQNFESALGTIQQQLKLIKQQGTYPRDIIARYPELKAIASLSSEHLFPVVVERVRKISDLQVKPDNELTLIIPEEGSECRLFYNAQVFDEEIITRLLANFSTLVAGIIADPKSGIADLPLLSGCEYQAIFAELDDSPQNSTQHRSIHQLFEERVQQTPDAIAVVFQEQQFTYQELNAQANQLAHHLQNLGVKPESMVGLLVERSLAMIVGLLGILKAGGTYVPLDPSYPTERLNFIVADADLAIILTQAKLLTLLTEYQGYKFCLDTDSEQISSASKSNPVSPVDSSNRAYLIYTSGSTGKPKGVEIEHRSLINFTQAAIAEYQIKQSDRVLQFASIGFDAAAEEIYPCLISGGTLVLRTDDMFSSVAKFLQGCQDWQITVLDLPTAYWQQMTAELEAAKLILPDRLRLVIIGGERVVPEYVKKWQQYVGDFPQLINSYGPTEGTVVNTVYKVTTATEIEQEVAIGKAIAGVRTYILDRNLQPVPLGITGEIYLGGSCLARGYLNQAELTAQKFIWHETINTRLYKTGDLGCYLNDGNIRYLGQIDSQVKIRGFRIELGEIESVLAQHTQIQQALVVAQEDTPGNKRLVAYIVTSTDLLTSSQLRSFLQQKLPEYMVPNAFVFLDNLPLTVNGKIDHLALPTPEIELTRECEYVAPRTPNEEIIANIFALVLNVSKIGINDNFFELGGHSLLATQVISRISQNFKVELSLRSLFEASTVTKLCSHLENILWMSSVSNLDDNQQDEYEEGEL